MKLFATIRTWLTWQGNGPPTLPHACVRHTGTAKGRGVYALRAFREGEVIEVCPVVVLGKPYEALPAEIQKLVFMWERREGSPDIQALALGYGSLYNNDNPANVRYEPDRSALALRFIAVRDISANEELTVNYSGDPDAEDWWFKDKSIEPIIGAGGERGEQ
jgi:SET domain-containing protein